MNVYEEILTCYNSLRDETSKKLFIARLSWNLSNDDEYLEQIEEFLPPKLKKLGVTNSNVFNESFKYIINKINAEYKQIVVYGLGTYGKIFVDEFSDKSKLIICDKMISQSTNEYKGIEVISKEKLLNEYSELDILVTTLKYENEIVEELMTAGISDNKIIRLSEKSRIFDTDEDSQYFENDVITPIENEIFIDCGFFEGETTKRFVDWCHGNYEKIYAFEPNEENIIEAFKNNEINNIKNLNVINKGVWEDTRKLQLRITERGDSCYICDEGTETISVTSIDEVLGGERATYIKMDVEGSEMKALYGAKKTIKKYHPRLAICIYHKPEDIVEIQRYIISLNPEYKFYIRQYSNYANEMVLYAV